MLPPDEMEDQPDPAPSWWRVLVLAAHAALMFAMVALAFRHIESPVRWCSLALLGLGAASATRAFEMLRDL